MKRVWIVALLCVAMDGYPCLADQATYRETALTLLEVTNTKKMVDQMMASIEGMMRQQFNALNLPPEGKEAAERLQKEMMDWFSQFLNWKEMQEVYVEIYLGVFTEEELKELKQFYKSPLGQKMLAKMPELLQRSMEKTQALLQEKMPEFLERLQKTISELQEKYQGK